MTENSCKTEYSPAKKDRLKPTFVDRTRVLNKTRNSSNRYYKYDIRKTEKVNISTYTYVHFYNDTVLGNVILAKRGHDTCFDPIKMKIFTKMK